MPDAAIRVSITPANGCREGLSWELAFGPAPSPATLVSVLKNDAWRDASRLPTIVELEHPEGHELIVIPKTGRVQLRVCYITPRLNRQATATRVATAIASMLGTPAVPPR